MAQILLGKRRATARAPRGEHQRIKHDHHDTRVIASVTRVIAVSCIHPGTCSTFDKHPGVPLTIARKFRVAVVTRPRPNLSGYSPSWAEGLTLQS